MLPVKLSDRVRLDRYAIKNSTIELQPDDLVVVSLQRINPNGEEKEYREVGQIVSKNAQNTFSIRVAPQKHKIATPGITSTPDGDYTILHGVQRSATEYIVEKDWKTICVRVCAGLLEVETGDDALAFVERLTQAMIAGNFIAAGRILTSLGRPDMRALTLYNCFIYAAQQDSREGIMRHGLRIFDTFARGGGAGWSMSIFRPKGAVVRKANGRSSGTTTWAELYSIITGLVEQGGSRRGSSMIAIDPWHPDVLDFIAAKAQRETISAPDGRTFTRSKKLLYNANVSVLISNAFMDAVRKDADWDLVFPDLDDPDYDAVWQGDLTAWQNLGKKVVVYQTIKARSLWDTIIKLAWESGEPGLLFIDRANEMSNSYYYANLICTNPCVTGDTRLHTQYGMVTSKELYETQKNIEATVDRRTLEPAQLGVTTRPSTPMFKTADMAKVYRVTTAAGYSLKCTDWHEFYSTKKGKVKLTELAVGDELLVQSGKGQFGNEGSYELGIILGLITGDGSISRIKIAGTDNEISGYRAILGFWGKDKELADELAKYVNNLIQNEARPDQKHYSVSACDVLTANKKQIASSILAEILSTYGFSAETKLQVPDVVWKGTEYCVKGYLKGLFQADATVNVADTRGRCSIHLASSYPTLLGEVQILLANFGILSRIYRRRAAGNRSLPDGKGGNKLYACKADYELILDGKARDLFMREIGFIGVSKNERYANWAKDKLLLKTQRFVSKIVSIDYVGEEPVYDVTQPDHNAVVFNGLVTGQCGEIYGPVNGVCNLAHINLSKFVTTTELPGTEITSQQAQEKFDWKKLRTHVRDGIRFLNDVIDINRDHDDEIAAQQLGERRIGLGVLGYGEMLIRLGLRYGSEEALKFTDYLFEQIWGEAYNTSTDLARVHGAFPKFDSAKFLDSGFIKQAHIQQSTYWPTILAKLKTTGIRNVTTMAAAPTGSVSVILETTGGVEPLYAFEYTSTTRIGTTEECADITGVLTKQFGADRTLWPNYAVTAQQGITPTEHVKTQAIVQKWLDNSVSKTVNLPKTATVQDVADVYMAMWDLGCKGGTVYRDGSRDEQVLYTSNTPATPASVPIDVSTKTIDAMRPRLEVGIGPTFSVPSPVGSLHVTIRHDPKTGDPEDIFITSGKGDITADVQAIGRLCSLILRLNGVPLSQQSKLELVREQLAGIPGRTQDGLPGQVRVSMPDTIAHVIERYLEGNFPLANMPFGAAQVDDLCKDFATMPQDTLGKLALYLKNQRASTPEPQTEPEEHDGKMFMLDLCPQCGTMSYQITGGCGYCHSCTYSRCG